MMNTRMCIVLYACVPLQYSAKLVASRMVETESGRERLTCKWHLGLFSAKQHLELLVYNLPNFLDDAH